MSWFHAARARLRLLSRRGAESRIDDEIRFHIDMESERLMRQEKLQPDDARRRALVTFGGVQQHRETLRHGRGTAWLAGLSLDLKLGGRMLLKYPGLTIVGGLAMAFGIWFGAVTFEMLGILVSPKLPLPDGDRIVQVENWDLKANNPEPRVLHDFLQWRGTVKSVVDLGAYRDLSTNIVARDGSAHPVVAAEMSASAFRIAPTKPLHGRVLDAGDERPGAAPVVVLGHDVWTERFGSDPSVVGRTMQYGAEYATVVGVMPAGFAFPISHEMWLPFKADAEVPLPLGGPPIHVFGRLAPDVTMETAQAELTALGERAAGASPATHANLRPRVVPYAKSGMNTADEFGMMALIYLFTIMLVVVVCSTVALLLFARAASREGEILVRSALGATRRRIVTQLFAEALVLGAVAATLGLVCAQLALSRWGRTYLEVNIGRLPFWYDFNVSPTTVLYALGLTVLGAAIAGIIPARKITRGLGSRLREGTAGGGGPSFGGIWTAVIVLQIALTVAFPAVVLLQRNEMKRIQSFDVGFPSHEYLAVKLELDAPVAEGADAEAALAAKRARMTASLSDLRRRLQEEPGVTGVTFVDRLPRDDHAEDLIEVVSIPGSSTEEVSMAAVDPSYFDVLNAPVRAGRGFTAGDLGPDARVVIVDEGFVDVVLKGRNPIGHQIWFTDGKTADRDASDRRVYEVVGVVKDLGMASVARVRRAAGVYFPATPGGMPQHQMIVHVRGDPLAIAPRVRAIATSVDPTLRLSELQRVDQVAAPLVWFISLWIRITIGLTAITLLLSLAGIYAVLSFTVARRTREIGVRVALGASARGVITSIFRRPLIQVSGGVLAGSVLVALAGMALENSEHFRGSPPGFFDSPTDVAALVAYAGLMFAVCLLACIVPTFRALRVQPTEALRAD